MIEFISKGFPYKPELGCFGMASSYLVHDNINILFDTGHYGARKKIIELLNNNKIDAVIISHLHFDHCSNLDLFINSNIPIYISKIEFDEYFKNKDKDCDLFSYFESIYKKLNIIFINRTKKVSNNTKIIFTKGHTNGHISLVINNDTILAGDALKTFIDYQNKDLFGNAVSKDDYVSTKKEIIKKYKVIYCGHDGIINNDVLEERGKTYEF